MTDLSENRSGRNGLNFMRLGFMCDLEAEFEINSKDSLFRGINEKSIF